MLYKPSQGKMKDNCMIWHDGAFYMYSMYAKKEADADHFDHSHYKNIWMARSEDGVHWTDTGTILELPDDSRGQIWSSAVYRADDRFIIQYASYGGGTDTTCHRLKTLRSDDLIYWETQEAEYDIVPPANPDGSMPRIDSASVFRYGDSYYGFGTGPYSFIQSKDGLKWTFSGRTEDRVDLSEMAPEPRSPADMSIEVGGCEMIDGRCYLLAGWFGCFGSDGYRIFTLRADTPDGMFKPDFSAFVLSGNDSNRWVNLWARFVRTDRELLVFSYMFDGHSYEHGNTWLPPLKKAVADSSGHLRLAYWPGNDAILGERIDISPVKWDSFHYESGHLFLKDILFYDSAGVGIVLSAAEYPSYDIPPVPPCSVAILKTDIGFTAGAVIRGNIRIECKNREGCIPKGGIVLAEDDCSAALILLDGCGTTSIGGFRWNDTDAFTPEDRIGGRDARPMGMTPYEEHSFRLILRGCMFEFYLDEMYVETFNTSRDDGIGGSIVNIGFWCGCGTCTVSGLEIFKTTL